MFESVRSELRDGVVRVGAGVALFGAVTLLGIVSVACSTASGPAAPMSIQGAGTPAATAVVGPTVTAAVPTADAIGTKTAPTIEAAATALAPTAVAQATAAARATGTPTPATAGQLAVAGQNVYSAHCAVCHGTQGEGRIGPALVGPAANFGTFKNAQDLYTFTSTLMPKANPGSLTPEQYLDVVAYVLVQDGFVSKDDPLSAASLEGIKVTR